MRLCHDNIPVSSLCARSTKGAENRRSLKKEKKSEKSGSCCRTCVRRPTRSSSSSSSSSSSCGSGAEFCVRPSSTWRTSEGTDQRAAWKERSVAAEQVWTPLRRAGRVPLLQHGLLLHRLLGSPAAALRGGRRVLRVHGERRHGRHRVRFVLLPPLSVLQRLRHRGC